MKISTWNTGQIWPARLPKCEQIMRGEEKSASSGPTRRQETAGVKYWLAGIAGAILPWLTWLSLNGCATPMTVTTVVEGTEITEHVDSQLPPGCEQAFPRGGCYQQRDGKHNIWYSALSPSYVRKHEIAHAQRMRHTVPWAWNGTDSCAIVTASGGGYRTGQRICIDQHGERVEGITNAGLQVGQLERLPK